MSRWATGALALSALAPIAMPAHAALASSATAMPAHAAIARPDPVLVSVRLDYVSPLRGASGSPALTPLDPTVSQQAVSDERYLRYRTRGDLGGFALAPVGASAASSGGRAIVGASGLSQIPQYGQAAEGVVRSFAFVGAGPGNGGGAPQNGRTPVPGLGTPPELLAPSNSNAVPPPNEGFGGQVSPPEGGKQPSGEREGGKSGGGKAGGEGGSGSGGSGGKSKSGRKSKSGGKQRPPATTPTTTPVLTPPPSEEGGQGSGGGGQAAGGTGGGGASCGTIGLAIASDHASCRIYAVNMEPGQSASETMTVRDEAGVPFTLSLRASGEGNRLWDDLRMGVWQTGASAPDPLPALLWWTTQDNVLATLEPGEAVSYEVELYLPIGAGNEDQGKTALIDLTWSAHQ